jgi:hypothetical protein
MQKPKSCVFGHASPVLWIDDVPPEIPDNRHTAEMWLKSLLNKFATGPADNETFYRAAMDRAPTRP